jgi:hypothetical protein
LPPSGGFLFAAMIPKETMDWAIKQVQQSGEFTSLDDLLKQAEELAQRSRDGEVDECGTKGNA